MQLGPGQDREVALRNDRGVALDGQGVRRPRAALRDGVAHGDEPTSLGGGDRSHLDHGVGAHDHSTALDERRTTARAADGQGDGRVGRGDGLATADVDRAHREARCGRRGDAVTGPRDSEACTARPDQPVRRRDGRGEVEHQTLGSGAGAGEVRAFNREGVRPPGGEQVDQVHDVGTCDVGREPEVAGGAVLHVVAVAVDQAEDPGVVAAAQRVNRCAAGAALVRAEADGDDRTSGDVVARKAAGRRGVADAVRPDADATGPARRAGQLDLPWVPGRDEVVGVVVHQAPDRRSPAHAVDQRRPGSQAVSDRLAVDVLLGEEDLVVVRAGEGVRRAARAVGLVDLQAAERRQRGGRAIGDELSVTVGVPELEPVGRVVDLAGVEGVRRRGRRREEQLQRGVVHLVHAVPLA